MFTYHINGDLDMSFLFSGGTVDACGNQGMIDKGVVEEVEPVEK